MYTVKGIYILFCTLERPQLPAIWTDGEAEVGRSKSRLAKGACAVPRGQIRDGKIARSCGTKQISKSKDLKIEGLRPLLGSSDVERAHAVLARRTYPYIARNDSQLYAALHYNYSYNNNIATTMPHYTTLHYTTLHYTTYSIYTTLHRAAMLHYTGLHSSTLPYANYSYTHATYCKCSYSCN